MIPQILHGEHLPAATTLPSESLRSVRTRVLRTCHTRLANHLEGGPLVAIQDTQSQARQVEVKWQSVRVSNHMQA